MKRAALWIIFIFALVALDALRDLLRGQASWWTWHAIKWLQFYPMLAYFWITKLGHWNARGLALRFAVVVVSLAIWNVLAIIYRPPHWGEYSAPFWLSWLF